MCYSRRKKITDRLFNLMSLLEKGEELGQIPSHKAERLREKYNRLIHQTMRLLDQKKNEISFKAETRIEEIIYFLREKEKKLIEIVRCFSQKLDDLRKDQDVQEQDAAALQLVIIKNFNQLLGLCLEGESRRFRKSRKDFICRYFELVKRIREDWGVYREQLTDRIIDEEDEELFLFIIDEIDEFFHFDEIEEFFQLYESFDSDPSDVNGPRQKYRAVLQAEKELFFLENENEEEEKLLEDLTELENELTRATIGIGGGDNDGNENGKV